MSAHDGHDHPATKAARAACRRAGTAKPTDHSDRIHTEAKARKTKAKASKGDDRPITKPLNTSLPHAYDPEIDRPDRCYVCKLTKRARVHDDGPTDLAARFGI